MTIARLPVGAPLAAALAGLAAAGCAAEPAAQRAERSGHPVPAVVLLGAPRKTVGTFREFHHGDRACYVTLTDDNGEPLHEHASFELCERGKALLGRRARLRYEVANVLAASCQGNMDCGKSDQEALVVEATPLPPVR